MVGVATLVLILVAAGYEFVQRRVPDLGRLPLIPDHRFHERLRGPGQTEAQAKADAELAAAARNYAKKIGVLMANHTRYRPPRNEHQQPGEGRIEAWQRANNEERRHNLATIASYLEDHHADVMAIVARLRARGAIAPQEVTSLNWTVGHIEYGYDVQALQQIAPLLTTGAARLETGEKPPEYEGRFAD